MFFAPRTQLPSTANTRSLQVTSDHTSRLIELYRRQSKHSEYQVLAPAVARILGNLDLANIPGVLGAAGDEVDHF